MIRKRLEIKDMQCVGCTMAVEGALEEIAGVRAASASYARQTAEVEYDETLVAEADLIAAVEMAGYTATVQEG